MTKIDLIIEKLKTIESQDRQILRELERIVRNTRPRGGSHVPLPLPPSLYQTQTKNKQKLDNMGFSKDCSIKPDGYLQDCLDAINHEWDQKRIDSAKKTKQGLLIFIILALCVTATVHFVIYRGL